MGFFYSFLVCLLVVFSKVTVSSAGVSLLPEVVQDEPGAQNSMQVQLCFRTAPPAVCWSWLRHFQAILMMPPSQICQVFVPSHFPYNQINAGSLSHLGAQTAGALLSQELPARVCQQFPVCPNLVRALSVEPPKG